MGPRTTEQKRTLERKLKYQYGMTVEDYWQMSEGQDHRCAICREPCATGQRLSVDHDHGRRKVRGLLCRTCNSGIGHLKDSPAVLSGSLRYLHAHGKAISTEDLQSLLDLHSNAEVIHENRDRRLRDGQLAPPDDQAALPPDR